MSKINRFWPQTNKVRRRSRESPHVTVRTLIFCHSSLHHWKLEASLNEHSFQRMISLERKRSERSRKPFLLALIDTGTCLPADKNGRV